MNRTPVPADRDAPETRSSVHHREQRPSPLTTMRNIHVRYDEVQALRGVDFDLYPGEIHALIGEHRAGKSSLVKLLSGAARKQQGEISLYGKKIEALTPAGSLQAGIGTVYQEPTIIPALDAVENIFTGQMLRKRTGSLNHQAMEERVKKLFEYLGLSIDVRLPVHKLTPAQQHMIEFARAIMMRPGIIILDEISNKLTPKEMKDVYRALFDYREGGAGIIYISHDLDEVLKLANRITILRNGYRRGTEATNNLDKYRLFQLTYSFTVDGERLEYSRMKFFLLKRYLENFINYLPLAAAILDPTGRVQLTNTNMSDIISHEPDQILDLGIDSILEIFPKETQGDIRKALDQHIQFRLAETELKDERPVNLQVIPLLDEENSFLGTAVLLEDVSIDRYMQNYLIQSEKMASVAEVAVGVAHEINNPLFIIKNYLQVIKDSTDDPEISDRIDRIDKEAARIVETVASLLSFSRMKEQPAPTVDLTAVISEVLTLLHHNLSEKHVRLSHNLPAGPALIHGNENKLKQVIMNLVMNSIDAVLDNGNIDINLHEQEEEAMYVFTVKDNGYGIPEDVAEEIFKPFFSTKVNKKNTGLGLSICRHIIEDHGGTINFHSVPGTSTEFIIRLPKAG
ncbi:MAG: ATP-binding cassette domain-containing protein [Spirochaetales bacterium]|nr:ATP-binding cassette domain-containing protein [Spirochaetales bacterium]MCF7938796.1 ATP-binding cassette domain-containing protein [Spirochaetales bacterium]